MPSEWTVDTLKAHLDELRAVDQRALALQHGEYLRRLEALNHAHERAMEERALFVSAERFDTRGTVVDDRFDSFVKRYEARHEEIVRAQTVADAGRAYANQGFRRMLALCTVILGAIAILVPVLLNHG